MYSESMKNANLKYQKEKLKRVPVNWKRDYYEQAIEPSIRASGMQVSTFIKKAVEEKIARDGLKQISTDAYLSD